MNFGNGGRDDKLRLVMNNTRACTVSQKKDSLKTQEVIHPGASDARRCFTAVPISDCGQPLRRS